MSIHIRNLSFEYPDGYRALREIDLVVEQGEMVALMGHNGAGKTTLVKHLNGLLRPTRGCVTVNGRDTRQCRPEDLSASVGTMFQNPDNQLFAASVEREIAFGPKKLGLSADSVARMTREAMKLTGITKFADRNPYDLSSSERKRVALASVVSMDPPLFLLDEPTQGQDYFGCEMIRRVLERLKRSGKSVICVTHDVDFAVANFDRAVIMKQGQITADGTMVEIAADMGFSHWPLPKPKITEIGQLLGLKTIMLSPKMLVSHLIEKRKESHATW